MSVGNKDEVYTCRICGNEVKVVKAGGGTLHCCGEEMGKVPQMM